MSDASRTGLSVWVSKRTHLQVSKTEVLPVIFKSRKAPSTASNGDIGPVPRAFPESEVCFSDSMTVVQEWLEEHLERMYRVGFMNMKPGSLETPDVLRSSKHRFTVWFEPTSASFAVLTPQQKGRGNETAEDALKYSSLVPTPQTLHIVGELET